MPSNECRTGTILLIWREHLSWTIFAEPSVSCLSQILAIVDDVHPHIQLLDEGPLCEAQRLPQSVV